MIFSTLALLSQRSQLWKIYSRCDIRSGGRCTLGCNSRSPRIP